MRTCVVLCLALWSSLAQAQMFFNAEAVFLGRDNDGGAEVIFGANQISTDGGSYSSESGYRLTIGGIFDNLQVDATFTQISPWTNSLDGDFTSNINLDTDIDFEGFLAIASELEGELEYLSPGTFDVSNRSNFKDVEIMIGNSYINRRWRLAGGYRYLQLDERNGLGIFGDLGEQVDGPDAPIRLSHDSLINAGATLISGPDNGLETGNEIAYVLQSNTKNQMHGFQTTFGLQILDNSWITIEGLLKAGIYCNNISGRVTETAAGFGPVESSVYQRVLNADKTAAAFAGNVGLRAVIAVTDYIDLIGGGEVLFLSGVALGEDQVSGVSRNLLGTNSYQVQNNGSVIAYGGTVGLRIYW